MGRRTDSIPLTILLEPDIVGVGGRSHPAAPVPDAEEPWVIWV